MALKKDYTTETGLSCLGAYIRVEQISLNKSGMTAEVRWRKAPSTPEFLSKTYEVPFGMNGANPIRQTYTHLKSLPEFAGAEDI